MDQRRVLLAAFLSLLIFVLWDMFVIQRQVPVEPNGPPPVTESVPGFEQLPVAPAPPPAAPARSAHVEARDVVIDTDLYRAVLTTGGGRLKSFKLKKYRMTVRQDSPPLELITQAVPNDLPLGVELRSAGGTIGDADVSYRADREQLTAADGEDAALTLTGELQGATVTKRFHIKRNYVIGVKVRVLNQPPQYVEMAVGWNKSVPESHGAEIVFDSVLTLVNNDLEQDSFADLETGKVVDKGVQWLAYSGRYFLAAMIPEVAAVPQLDPPQAFSAVRAWLKQRGNVVEAQLLIPARKFETDLDVYIGPKILDALEEAGHSLKQAALLGWTGFLAQQMLALLEWLHRYTGNYGVDIILLTVLVKIVFFPLTRSSLKSMKEMQRLQPFMADIRERYKDKPEEMNRAIMELYRKNKVNPLGGCLPMIVQIPVFIGLYQALANAIELRHAPFALWINDLSAPDRLGSLKIPFVEPAGIPVLTLLMGASMLVQQWMTPAPTADPIQQRLMMLMPIVFTFLFINFPAGLTLYWLVNNLLTIGQQVLINRVENAKGK